MDKKNKKKMDRCWAKGNEGDDATKNVKKDISKIKKNINIKELLT